jgi:heat shock protein HslJ
MALGFASCAGDRAEPPSSQAQDDVAALAIGEWSLRAIRGEAPDPSAGPRPPTMTIAEDGRVGGFAGVNQWGSTLDLDALGRAEFSLEPPFSTLMAGPPQAMRLEQQFLGAIGEARRVSTDELRNGRLVLLDASGAEVLRFLRAP